MYSSDDDSGTESTSALQLLARLHSLRSRIKLKSNPLDEMSCYDVFVRYRFSKDSIYFILQLIINKISTTEKYEKSTDIPPLLQLLTALRFNASGTFKLAIGDLCQSSQPTCCRIVKRVSKAIASLREQFIKFPTFEEAEDSRLKFYRKKQFPGIFGALDCTHVLINCPGGADAELFRNRKGSFSVSVQAVCDAECKFLNVVARWPGSVHDSRIFENSLLQLQLENGEVPSALIGDTGYASEVYLLTPIVDPQSAAERRYNRSHPSTTNPIERAFGVLKKGFFCLGQP